MRTQETIGLLILKKAKLENWTLFICNNITIHLKFDINIQSHEC